jgi:hypothetical protein
MGTCFFSSYLTLSIWFIFSSVCHSFGKSLVFWIYLPREKLPFDLDTILPPLNFLHRLSISLFCKCISFREELCSIAHHLFFWDEVFQPPAPMPISVCLSYLVLFCMIVFYLCIPTLNVVNQNESEHCECIFFHVAGFNVCSLWFVSCFCSLDTSCFGEGQHNDEVQRVLV